MDDFEKNGKMTKKKVISKYRSSRYKKENKPGLPGLIFERLQIQIQLNTHNKINLI